MLHKLLLLFVHVLILELSQWFLGVDKRELTYSRMVPRLYYKLASLYGSQEEDRSLVSV